MTLYIMGVVMAFVFLSQFIALSLEHPELKHQLLWPHGGSLFIKFLIVLVFSLCWPVLIIWQVGDATFTVYFKKKTPRWLRIWKDQ